MRKSFLSPFLPALLALLTSLPGLLSAASGPDEVFAAANRDFEAGKYSEAAAGYLDLARTGQISAELYFNLGTASYRLGKTGEAILWMRRALVVDPGMPEVRQSLAFLSGKFGYLEFSDSRVARFIGSLPGSFFRWVFSLALWTALIALGLALAVERLRPNRAALVALFVIAGLTALLASRVGHYRDTRLAVTNFATITAEGAKALTAPAPEAKAVIDLPPGSEVRILRESGSWRYAEIPGDLRGWIPSTALESVWPLPLSRISNTP